MIREPAEARKVIALEEGEAIFKRKPFAAFNFIRNLFQLSIFKEVHVICQERNLLLLPLFQHFLIPGVLSSKILCDCTALRQQGASAESHEQNDAHTGVGRKEGRVQSAKIIRRN